MVKLKDASILTNPRKKYDLKASKIGMCVTL